MSTMVRDFIGDLFVRLRGTIGRPAC